MNLNIDIILDLARKIKFGGIEVGCLDKLEEYIKFTYGNNWMIPNNNWKGDEDQTLSYNFIKKDKTDPISEK